MNVPNPNLQKRLEKLESLADWMDTRWTLPGTSIRLGMDTIIGLIPGIGDTATMFISAWIIKEAHELGVPFWVKLRMTFNLLIDWLIGTIPLLGDIFDIGWKANKRNVELVRRHLIL